MKKFLQLSYVVVFAAGLLIGSLFGKEAHAQSFSDTTASSGSHLRVASNTYDDRLTLKIYPGTKTMKYVKVFDIIGNEVASIDLSGKTGASAYSLDASHLENGIYLCNLYSDKGIVETKKVYWSKQ